ncbi:recombinase family protein [Flavobacterium salilacus subsp. salilacus]|uniref:recombinase family protein n=1 Tax=Flavobacterium TaxID=237 RepID=UPI001074CBF2|nr:MULTISPECIES: recombinase family protein [Flavobacterium]KAF2520055.1 recombinase family protein [Flavobacterium salilacus subsp. salilacus]MBE1614029.1 recombinase family protein [Flavobacterium sp. SaA2.13]
MKKARYIRVSSATQNNIRQLEKAHPDERVFIDVVSGAVPFNEREQGKALIDAVEAKEIDYISTSQLDRLGRDSFNIIETCEYFNKMGVILKIDNLGIESLVGGKPSPTFKMITAVLANVAEMQRDSIRESQEQGIKIAKAQGKFKGRAKGTTLSDNEFLSKHKAVVKELRGGTSIRKTAKLCDVSVSTVQRVKKILE